ncbi:MAG: D-2-hydroxyacid dehydrogenase [Treponema sp.]
MKLTVLDGYALNPGDLNWDSFSKYADITVFERTPQELAVEHIGNSDAILLNKVKITSDILSKCTNLKYIGVLATGYNVIDVDAVKKAEICATFIPDYSTNAVAQHVFALITYFTNHVAVHNESVINGDWTKNPDFCYWKKPLIELCGKTLGILGYGKIGRQTAKIAEAFGMNVIVCPHKITPEIEYFVNFDSLLKKSNFISLHVPLTEETEEIIDSSAISKMRDGAYIINTARGGLINENDMRAALDSGKIGGYAADVLSQEPMSPDCPLLNAPNCVLTPHIAWAPPETRARLLKIAVENFASYLEGNVQNSIC